MDEFDGGAVLDDLGFNAEANCLEPGNRSNADLQFVLFERSTAFVGKPILNSPSHVNVVVAGGVGIKQTVVPGWAGGSRPVTVVL